MTEVSQRRIGGFSRGMRQRLGLAQALVNRPEVLFLDEAVSMLRPSLADIFCAWWAKEKWHEFSYGVT